MREVAIREQIDSDESADPVRKIRWSDLFAN